MKRIRFENGSIDAVDAEILALLTEDARMSVAEIARTVGLSAPSVSERIKRMEEAGVIRGYAVEIDPRAIGLALTVWLRIRPAPGAVARVAEIIREERRIVLCDRVTGDDCYIARAHVADVADLEDLIDRFADCAATNTSIAQSSPTPRRAPAPPRGA